MGAGRPLEYETVDELQAKIDEYFDNIKGEFHFEAAPVETDEDEGKDIKVWDRYPEPPTITGLTLFLGFESRQSFYDYKNKTEFSYTIKRARLKVENSYELFLIQSKNPTGAIFALKNLGWADKQIIEHGGSIDNRFVIDIAEPVED